MKTAALLGLIESTGENVLVLTESLSDADFKRSRLTRASVKLQLVHLARSVTALPPELRRVMTEIDWDGWIRVGRSAAQDSVEGDDSAWFAVRSLVPATLSWLRIYRQQEPQWFAYSPP
ncbi:MAG: hypothetical protein JNJ71_18080 [Rubrivivax sp.]|nr:hypothetical protein [Rubrivivax sp.]